MTKPDMTAIHAANAALDRAIAPMRAASTALEQITAPARAAIEAHKQDLRILK